ncbi:hypothetical protein BsWGS_28584 [Bradybaena similaris]
MEGQRGERDNRQGRLRKGAGRNVEEKYQEDTRDRSIGKKEDERDNTLRHLSPNEDYEVTTDTVENYIPTPPNGGWGWVIVCASMIGNLIVDGISYSFGVFLLEFVDAYKETKSKVSLVGSLLSGVYLFVGPIVSALTNKYGCRPIVIAGSITATAGFVLATLSPNIDVLIFTYGVIGGCGLGMIYLPCIVSVGHYFDTKRAFATGLAVCGSGLGTFIFPPLSEFLLTEYSWQGGLLIIAGIMFQGCVCGILMRPLEAKGSATQPSKQPSKQPSQQPRAKSILDRVKESTHLRSVSESGDGPVSAREAQTIQERVLAAKILREKRLWDPNSISEPLPQFMTTKREDREPVNYYNSGGEENIDVLSTTDDKQSEDMTAHGDLRKSDQRISNGGTSSVIAEILPLLEVPAPIVHSAGAPPGSLRSLHVSKDDLARPLYRKDIFYSGSVSNIPEFHSQPDMQSYIASITVIPRESAVGRLCSCLPTPVQDVLGEMLDVSLLKDLGFMMICLGNFTAFLGMYVPFMFIVDRTASQGVNRSQAAFLISVIGISNTAGRVVIGKVADLHIVDSLVITYVAVAIMGVATGLVPFCNTYPLLATAAAVFGLGMAAFIALSSIVICDRMGVEKLTNAFGLLTLVRGTAAILGPPFAGFMFDSTGSYDLSFFIGGLMLLAGAACLVLLHLPCFKTSQDIQNLREQDINTLEKLDLERK